MTFSGFQLTAILKLAKAMVFADGKVTAEESVILVSEFSRFGVPSDNFNVMLNESDKMKASEALAIVASLTNSQKKHVCGYLAAVMTADGVDETELALWSFISTIAQLPTMTIQEAVEFWAK